MSKKKIVPVDAGVRQIIDGNQSKMAAVAAMLDERRCWSSKGTFL
jgi:hypothetical protein